MSLNIPAAVLGLHNTMCMVINEADMSLIQVLNPQLLGYEPGELEALGSGLAAKVYTPEYMAGFMAMRGRIDQIRAGISKNLYDLKWSVTWNTKLQVRVRTGSDFTYKPVEVIMRSAALNHDFEHNKQVLVTITKATYISESNTSLFTIRYGGSVQCRFHYEYGKAHTALDPNPKQLETLSDREVEILHLLCCGYSNKEVAKVAGITANTVKTHRNKINSKTCCHDITQLINFGHVSGVLHE